MSAPRSSITATCSPGLIAAVRIAGMYPVVTSQLTGPAPSNGIVGWIFTTEGWSDKGRAAQRAQQRHRVDVLAASAETDDPSDNNAPPTGPAPRLRGLRRPA